MKQVKRWHKRQLLGTTSWVIPGTYYENVDFITKYFKEINFIELLVYTWDDDTHKLFEKEKSYLLKIAKQRGITYTVHLPTDDICNVVKAFEYLEENLKIANYVLHPYCKISESLYTEKLNTLLEHPKVAIENLIECIQLHKRTVFDIGHHLLGLKVDADFLKKVVELHIMGVSNGKDHEKLNDQALQELYNLFSNKLFEINYLCFEIFNEDDLAQSLQIWEEFKILKIGKEERGV